MLPRRGIGLLPSSSSFSLFSLVSDIRRNLALNLKRTGCRRGTLCISLVLASGPVGSKRSNRSFAHADPSRSYARLPTLDGYRWIAIEDSATQGVIMKLTPVPLH